MKKLVEINVACNWGSTGRIAEQIGLKAMQYGWGVHIAHSSRYVNDTKLQSYQLQSRFADYVHKIWNSLILGRSGLGSRQATKKFLKYLDKINPDIVHLHNIHGYYINYELLLRYLAEKNIPVVWTMHDCWPITGHCAYFDRIDCQKWKMKCHSCELKKDFPKSLLFDTSKSAFRLKQELLRSIPNLTFVPVSGWLGDIVRHSMIGKYAKVQIIHNGVDLNVFRPHKSYDNQQIAKPFRILGVAAGFGDRKGLEDFNKLRKMLNDDYEIKMVGLHSDEMGRIVPGIKGIEHTNSVEELVKLYNEADVYINPTYSDNFPTTNIEALACGTPVITYRTGGSPEAVDDLTGAVIEQGNIEELCSKIVEFKNTGFQQLHSTDCRKRAEECFDKDRCFEKYVELYESLLK